MKSTFTKGPWTYDKQYTDNFLEYFRICDRHGVPIVKTPNVDVTSEFGNHQAEDEANARLIAAAPDAVELLEQILRRLDLEAATLGEDAVFCCAAYRDDIQKLLARIEGGAK